MLGRIILTRPKNNTGTNSSTSIQISHSTSQSLSRSFSHQHLIQQSRQNKNQNNKSHPTIVHTNVAKLFHNNQYQSYSLRITRTFKTNNNNNNNNNHNGNTNGNDSSNARGTTRGMREAIGSFQQILALLGIGFVSAAVFLQVIYFSIDIDKYL